MSHAGCRWLGVLLVAGWAFGCLSHRLPPDVVAQIGETPVAYAAFEDFLERSVGEDAEGLESEVLSALFDQFLEERLLARLARDSRVTTEGASDRRAIQALFEASAEEAIDRSEVEDYYREHRQDFALPERVELHQILVEDRETAQAALEEIEAGADFEELARRVSIDPSAPLGGYQGELGRDDLSQKLAEAIFVLEEDEISDIIEADYGYHLFWVARKLPAEIVPVEAVEAEIVDKLRVARADRQYRELLAQAQERYDVRIAADHLPFRYRPAEGSRVEAQIDTD